MAGWATPEEGIARSHRIWVECAEKFSGSTVPGTRETGLDVAEPTDLMEMAIERGTPLTNEDPGVTWEIPNNVVL